MRLKKDYEYVVRDVTNNILGVFETEGLAHQFIQRMGQTPKKSKWGIERYEYALPCEMLVQEVKKR